MTKAANLLKIFEEEMPADVAPVVDMPATDEPAAAEADPVMDAAQKLADMLKDGVEETAVTDFMMTLEEMSDADKMMVMAKAMSMACPPKEDDAEMDPDAKSNDDECMDPAMK